MDREKIKGYLFGMLTALCWASSPILIKQGFDRLPSYIWGTVIGSFAAGLVYILWLLIRKQARFREVLHLRNALIWQAAGGMTGGLGVLARNIALETRQVAVVIALAQMTGLFTIIFGPLLLGRSFNEKITPRLVFGVSAIISGAVLILYGQSL